MTGLQTDSYSEASRFAPVSVVVALYNGEKWIEQTLNSVLAQTRPPREIFVVDDGSTDGAPARLADVGAAVRLLQNPGQGPQEARQHGIACSTMPYIAILDHDDLWHPDHLALLCAYMEATSDCVLVGGGYRPFSASTDIPFTTLGAPEWRELDAWSWFPECPFVSPSSTLIRASALREIGGWLWCDFYMYLRLAQVGRQAITDLPTLHYRMHEEQRNRSARRFPAAFLQETIIDTATDAIRHHEHVEDRRVLDAIIQLQALTREVEAGRTPAPSTVDRFADQLSRLPMHRCQSIARLFAWIARLRIQDDEFVRSGLFQLFDRIPQDSLRALFLATLQEGLEVEQVLNVRGRPRLRAELVARHLWHRVQHPVQHLRVRMGRYRRTLLGEA